MPETVTVNRDAVPNIRRIVSLGAGVQSTVLLLMGIHGEFGDRPDVAIFADTGWEPRAVYEHLAWLERFAASVGFPILRVSSGNIRNDAIANAEGRKTRTRARFAALPFFVPAKDRHSSMLRRQCTNEYKLQPIRRGIRRLTGGRSCECWIGISLDEYQRMRDSDVKYITHRYPLVDSGMTRAGCVLWLERHGYPIPSKSSCVGCPLHSNHVWREMKLTDPESWSQAIAFDETIRHLPRIDGEVFLHRSLKPLADADIGEDQIDLWATECTGMCGT